MLMVFVAVVEHEVDASVIINVTVVIPAPEYVTPVGFCVLLVDGVALVPKSHAQVTPVAVPVLVKLTGKPVHWGAVEVKLAVGVLSITMVSITV
jgi:hypothetical protein